MSDMFLRKRKPWHDHEAFKQIRTRFKQGITEWLDKDLKKELGDVINGGLVLREQWAVDALYEMNFRYEYDRFEAPDSRTTIIWMKLLKGNEVLSFFDFSIDHDPQFQPQDIIDAVINA